MELSIVIPTYNEAGNIGSLLQLLDKELSTVSREYLVIDDNSPDKTGEVAAKASPHCRAIVRTEERGLATAVARGFAEAKGDYILVMDADHQHPPEAVRRMVEKARETGADVVIGSRHVEGGDDSSFSLIRKMMSRGAALMARIALPPVRKHGISDPMTGLFMFNRSKVDLDVLRPQGFKILLEILGRCPVKTVEEVGYSFGTRNAGESKLGGGVMAQYLVHLFGLAARHPENRRIFNFGLVGLSGVVLNLLLLFGLTELVGLHYLLSAAIAVEVTILSNFFLNDKFTFHDRLSGQKMGRLLRFNTVSLLSLVVNLGLLILFKEGLGLHYLLAESLAIVGAFSTNYLGNLHWTYGGKDLDASIRSKFLPWLPFLIVITASGGFIFSDLDHVDELHWDEHYYVSVAKQMNNGIWDDGCWDENDELYPRPLNYEHPPLAKELIAISTALFDTTDKGFGECRRPESAEYRAFTDDLRENGNPVSWRLPSAILGWLSVVTIGLASHRLFGTTGAAATAAALVAMDNLVLGTSRTAILDMYAGGFTAIAIYFATGVSKKSVWLSSLMLSLGFACKYPAGFAGPAILLLHLVQLKRANLLNRKRFDMALVAFAVLPLPILALTYTPWWIQWIPEMGFFGAIGHWGAVLQAALGWGTVGNAPHPDVSAPGTWFAMTTPVWYYTYHTVPNHPGWEWYIYAIGNPILWWIAAASIIASAVALIRRRSEANMVWFAASFLPLMTYAVFFVISRQTFLFYMALIVPMFGLTIVGAIEAVRRQFPQHANTFRWAILLVVLFGFMWFLPVTLGYPISPEMKNRIFGLIPWMNQ